MSRSVVKRALAALLLTAGVLVALPAPVQAAVLAPTDYCLDECDDILPPGQNGNATLADILAHQALGFRPAHSADQLGKYANLVSAYTGLTTEQIDRFYNDASFGVPAGQVERSYSPRADVTIVRDKTLGVPHVTGTTRAGTMFGAGYAGAEDRLFVMDLLRRVGRGQLTPFAGGAPGNRELEQSIWRNAPYTEADLQAQVAALQSKGPRGAQLYADVQQYIAGINAYIAACMSGRNCPGEYVLTGHLDAITNAGGPEPFQMTDLIAIAGVVGGLFGGGGGGEVESALVRVTARARYGAVEGDRLWTAFRSQNDEEATLTLHAGQTFPYGAADPDAAGVALPDQGSVTAQPVVFNPSGSATTTAGLAPGAATKRGMSNAVVVDAAHSATGNPIAVFGPQTGYFSPQLLMLQELQGPGISAHGVAFAGLNLYVLLGRGQDYAWSATSAEQDITDTYAVPLCNVDGSPATRASEAYLFRGACTPMEKLTRTNAWTPTVADSTPAGSYQLTTFRTKYGLVAWRGAVGGQPVAFTQLRSTYRHEADSAIGFQAFNDPAAMGSASAFVTAASDVGYAFNWFYVNAAETGYFNSGSNPVRKAGANPNLPTKAEAAYEWSGWNPDTNTADYAPVAQHPQSTGQDYFVSWNNKQAAGFSAADGNFSFGAVHRADLLDRRVRAALANNAKLDRAGVVRLVEDAAVTDLRAEALLPELLRILGGSGGPDVAKLAAWQAAGAKRVETTPGSHVYLHADAIRIFDAWWPRLVDATFRPGLGDDVYAALTGALQIDESPSGYTGPTSAGSLNQSQSHKGSAFQYGWWGYLDKDLRTVLGDPVRSGLGRTYCGGGDLAACRQVLTTTLAAAAAQPATTTYPGDEDCAAGDQWCADTIIQSPLGGITHDKISWQNRPTYQQAVSFPARRGDSIANLAQGRSVSANGTFIGYSAGAAVDGDPTTRWSSWWTDNQSITVDLGSARTVRRVILRWEAAYGSRYRIEASSNGSSWTAVSTVDAGNGGTDSVVFAPVTARYVRMAGVDRATDWGYSLWELEVYAR
ncbi:penicillin acylase family protein [Dactylosporangium sp. AC04546]|uniref:penicillin acylase family protein n=1 Tax=Dactylosporangium sp. AC04546 TaxID=2862460 RepID=UPI001EDF7A31|nr:penicillin acylase family protein [Dactylosporangium sp. AC04546]WVK85882.1 penicillin acylase family protein [Dactylosporangium sp. AC04546]